jgi:hypothetical protein
MRSKVADSLRRADHDHLRSLSASERIALALSLGERDADIYAAAHGVTHDEAVRALEVSRRAGRRWTK